MEAKSLKVISFVTIAVASCFLSTASAVVLTSLGTQDINNREKPSFISNTMLVKFTAQARANLKVTGEDVNPAGTGLPSLDVISRDFSVRGFRSIMTAGAHRDQTAAINSYLPVSK